MAQFRLTELLAAAPMAGDEVMLVSQPDPSVVREASTLFMLAADNSINDPNGFFIAEGFAVGDQVKISGVGFSELTNNIFSTNILSVTANKMVVSQDILADEPAGTMKKVQKWNSRRMSTDELVLKTNDQTITGDKTLTGAVVIRNSPGGGTPEPTLVIGGAAGGLVDDVDRFASVEAPHRLLAEENVALMNVWCNATQNALSFGGDDSAPGATKYRNAATSIRFYTAPNNSTLGGTLALEITSAGVNVAVPLQISGNNIYHQNGIDVSIADGGTGASDPPTARVNLGLGTMATQNANAVAITGGTAHFVSASDTLTTSLATSVSNAFFSLKPLATTASMRLNASARATSVLALQVANGAGSSAFDLDLNPYGGNVMVAGNPLVGLNGFYLDAQGTNIAAMKLIGSLGADPSSNTYVILAKHDDISRIQGVLYATKGSSNFNPVGTYLISGATAQVAGATIGRRTLSCICVSGGGNTPGTLVTLTHGGVNYIALEFTTTGSASYRAFYFQGLVRNTTDMFVDLAANVSAVAPYNGGTSNPIALLGTSLASTSVSGLGTAAAANLTVTQASTTAGQALKVGDFGNGLLMPQYQSDLNTLTTPGVVMLVGSAIANYPSGFGSSAVVIEVKAASTETTAGPHSTNGRIIQRATKYLISGDAKIVAVRGFDGTTWTAWFYDYGLALTAADARNNLGLGTAATATLTTSTTDATTGRVLKVADFNLFSAPAILSSVDMNTMSAPGRFVLSATGLLNGPGSFGGELDVTNFTLSGNTAVFQRYTVFASGSYGRQFQRARINATDWTPWVELLSNLGAVGVSATPNYNLFTVTGIYIMSGTGATNGPAAAAFILIVSAGATSTTPNDRIVQVATRLSTPFDTFTRAYDGTAWSAWTTGLSSADLSVSGNRFGVLPYVDASGHTQIGATLSFHGADNSVDTYDWRMEITNAVSGDLVFRNDDTNIVANMTNNGRIHLLASSAVSPMFSRIGGTDTGVDLPGSSVVNLVTAAVGRLTINTTEILNSLPLNFSTDPIKATTRVNLGIGVAVPASATAAGTAGQIAYDSTFLYVCTATNTWRRTALSSW